MEPRKAIVSGSFDLGTSSGLFNGLITFEQKDDGIYYVWELESESGEFLGRAGRSVSLRVIPEEENPFQYALLHAIEHIRRYRMLRKRVFTVEAWGWKSDS